MTGVLFLHNSKGAVREDLAVPIFLLAVGAMVC